MTGIVITRIISSIMCKSFLAGLTIAISGASTSRTILGTSYTVGFGVIKVLIILTA